MSEVEEEMMALGYEHASKEAQGLRAQSATKIEWFSAEDERAPPPADDEVTEAEEEPDDEDGLTPGRKGWTPPGWPTTAQAKRRVTREGSTASTLYLGRTKRAVWPSEGADKEELRGTALERFRDRITVPIWVQAQSEPAHWRITKGGLADTTAKAQVLIPNGQRTNRMAVRANTSERSLYSSCIRVVFTRAGERYTQAIPWDVTEPHLHALIRRMFGLADGEYRVRYGGGGPFRVQPQMSITITESRQPRQKMSGSAQMRQQAETHEIDASDRWGEQTLGEEAQRRWPDLKDFTLRYDDLMEFHMRDGMTV
jgi:hypothetical protein